MPPLRADDARESSQRWLLVAVTSLIVAGLQALLLVVGRLPGIAPHLSGGLFFKRALVVHVDLSLIVWFYAFLVALYFLLPSPRLPALTSRLSSTVAVVGILLFVSAAGVPGALPILSNYVPFVDHPVFTVGLCLFALGLVLAVLDRRLMPSAEGHGFFPVSAAPAAGIRAGVLALLLALVTFVASAVVTPRDLPAESYYEVLAWGGGHVLLFANVAGMTAVWLILLEGALGRPPVGYRTASLLYALLVTPLLTAPILALSGSSSRAFFTQLMTWGIFPVVTVFIVLCVRALVLARHADPELAPTPKDPRVLAFLASALLTLTGFALGASIRGSNTLIPGHYHASIGAVTVVYMALTYQLLGRFGLRLPEGRMVRWPAWQPPLFGVGQCVFALGFAMAGAHGMARKAYGAQQHIRSASEAAGLVVMALGGLVAVSAGIVFLLITARAWLTHSRRPQAEERGRQWNKTSIRYSG